MASPARFAPLQVTVPGKAASAVEALNATHPCPLPTWSLIPAAPPQTGSLADAPTASGRAGTAHTSHVCADKLVHWATGRALCSRALRRDGVGALANGRAPVHWWSCMASVRRLITRPRTPRNESRPHGCTLAPLASWGSHCHWPTWPACPRHVTPCFPSPDLGTQCHIPRMGPHPLPAEHSLSLTDSCAV